MSAAHTPGRAPWTYDDRHAAVNDADGNRICDVVDYEAGPLLTAAPQLAEALRLIANAQQSELSIEYARGIARAALTAAGVTP